jgi:hypothetical protein
VGSTETVIEGSIRSNNNITIGNNANVSGNVWADNLPIPPASAVIGGTVLDVSDLPLLTMQDIVDNLTSKSIPFTLLGPNAGAVTYTATNVAGPTNITGSGIYVVDGALSITALFTGNATFITNGNITVANSSTLTLTGLVPISDLFPQGLALYSGTGTVAFGAGSGFAIGDGAGNITGAIYGAGNVTINTGNDVHPMTIPTPVPEPASLLLLAIGVGTLGLTARRRRKDQD